MKNSPWQPLIDRNLAEGKLRPEDLAREPRELDLTAKDDGVIALWIFVETQSEANNREHWVLKAKRAAIQRREAHEAMNAWFLGKPGRRVKYPCSITITRVSPRGLDDDNLARSAKAIRDGLADSLRIDDRSPSVKWLYEQKRDGKLKAVQVRIEERNASGLI